MQGIKHRGAALQRGSGRPGAHGAAVGGRGYANGREVPLHLPGGAAGELAQLTKGQGPTRLLHRLTADQDSVC